MNKTSVDSYLRDGCGRCEHYQTPACKVHLWSAPLVALRKLVRATELVEAMKWGHPTYTLGGKNVVMISAFKDFCALQFFQGAALTDDDGLLVSPGPNSRFARYLKFTTLAEVTRHRAVIVRLLDQAIALAASGAKVAAPPPSEEVPAELAARLAADPALRRAFAALTPGRRRSHLLHITGAKQSETRARRVDRSAVEILAGRGWNER